MKQPRKQDRCVPFILVMNENERYMLEALDQAKIALLNNEVPVGAIIVCHGKIIGRGYNTRESTSQVVGHAEMNAIKQACEYLNSWKLDECSIYVTLEPCLMCAGTLQQGRIGKIYYGASDYKAGALGGKTDILAFQGLNHYPLVFSHILENQCKELIDSFFQNIRIDKQKGL